MSAKTEEILFSVRTHQNRYKRKGEKKYKLRSNDVIR